MITWKRADKTYKAYKNKKSHAWTEHFMIKSDTIQKQYIKTKTKDKHVVFVYVQWDKQRLFVFCVFFLIGGIIDHHCLNLLFITNFK